MLNQPGELPGWAAAPFPERQARKPVPTALADGEKFVERSTQDCEPAVILLGFVLSCYPLGCYIDNGRWKRLTDDPDSIVGMVPMIIQCLRDSAAGQGRPGPPDYPAEGEGLSSSPQVTMGGIASPPVRSLWVAPHPWGG